MLSSFPSNTLFSRAKPPSVLNCPASSDAFVDDGHSMSRSSQRFERFDASGAAEDVVEVVFARE
jgi:hypothetical protein